MVVRYLEREETVDPASTETITIWGRNELGQFAWITVLARDYPDSARMLFEPTTQHIDRAYLKQLIPVGKTFIHPCRHDIYKDCSRDIMDET